MNDLQHHGILGQKWGVRRYQNKDGTLTPAGQRRLDKKDAKWARTKGAKVTEKVEKSIKKDLRGFEKNELAGIPLRNSNGQLSKSYINLYNQKMAQLMNEKVGDIPSPSGRVLRYIAKRGEVGVHTALADAAYNMEQVKRGVNTAGRIAYKKEVLQKG